MKFFLVLVLSVVGCAVDVGQDPVNGAAGSVAVLYEGLSHQPAPGSYEFDNITNLDFFGNLSSDCETLGATLRPFDWQRWEMTPQDNGCSARAVRQKFLDFGAVRTIFNCRTVNRRRLCSLGEGNSTNGSSNNSSGLNWNGVAHLDGTQLTIQYSAFASNVL